MAAPRTTQTQPSSACTGCSSREPPSRRKTMDRTQLLDRFRSGVAEIDAALDAITDAELDQPAPDGGWTARQVVHHLADSEARAFVRLRRLIAEDEPQIIGYDEPEYARRLHYDRPID